MVRRGIYRFEERGWLPRCAAALLATMVVSLAVAHAGFRLARGGLVSPGPLAALAAAPVLAVFGLATATLAIRITGLRSRRAGIATQVTGALIGLALGWVLRLWWWPVAGDGALPALDTSSLAASLGDGLPRGLELGGLHVRGAALAGLLAGETLLVAGLLAAVCAALYREPLCPRCRHWCRRRAGLMRTATADSDQLIRELEARNWPWFRHLGEPRRDARDCLRFDLSTCKCGHTAALSAVREHAFLPPRELARHMLLGRDDLRTVEALAQVRAARG